MRLYNGIVMRVPENIEEMIYREEWTPEEQEVLETWMKESAENEKVFIAYRRVWRMGKYAGYWRKCGGEKDWWAIVNRLDRRRRKRKFLRIAGVAAMLVMMLGGIGWGWKFLQSPVAEQELQSLMPRPGTSKALLVLSSGKQISLGNVRKPEISEEGVIIQNDSAMIVYSPGKEKLAGKEKFNELIVPVGGEYKLCLNDGSIVYLNSLSRLRYPVCFKKDKREVILEGEAYFEVSPDEKRPFVVHTEKFGVSVLGTSFNIMSYPADSLSEITLVSGKVDVRVGRRSTVLKPSEQIVVGHRSLETTVRIVNTADYIGWKDGLLNFRTIPFGELAVKLERWFNVDFKFSDERLKQLKFSGAFRKYDDIGYILSLIEKTSDVSFKINRHVIMVNRR